MVHKLLVKRGWGIILFGSILFFIVGPIAFAFLQPPVHTQVVRHGLAPELLEIIKAYYRMSVGSGIGAIGIIFIIFGTVYLLTTVILEYMKRRRYAHRSSTYE